MITRWLGGIPALVRCSRAKRSALTAWHGERLWLLVYTAAGCHHLLQSHVCGVTSHGKHQSMYAIFSAQEQEWKKCFNIWRRLGLSCHTSILRIYTTPRTTWNAREHERSKCIFSCVYLISLSARLPQQLRSPVFCLPRWEMFRCSLMSSWEVKSWDIWPVYRCLWPQNWIHWHGSKWEVKPGNAASKHSTALPRHTWSPTFQLVLATCKQRFKGGT